MSINSRGDEEFVKMPPSEDDPLLQRNRVQKKFILVQLYEDKLKPRVPTCSDSSSDGDDETLT